MPYCINAASVGAELVPWLVSHVRAVKLSPALSRNLSLNFGWQRQRVVKIRVHKYSFTTLSSKHFGFCLNGDVLQRS